MIAPDSNFCTADDPQAPQNLCPRPACPGVDSSIYQGVSRMHMCRSKPTTSRVQNTEAKLLRSRLLVHCMQTLMRQVHM